MLLKRSVRIALCFALLGSLAGCPGSGNVVGWWAVTESPGDTNSLLLFADGSADYTMEFGDFEGGSWTLAGNAITVIFNLTNENFEKTFQGTVSGGAMNGTWSQGAPNVASGTFAATKIVP